MLTAMGDAPAIPENERPWWERLAAAMRRRGALRRHGILRGPVAAASRSHRVPAGLSRECPKMRRVT